MKMNSLFKCVGLVLMGAVLVQAQTMRVYPKTSFWADYVVSSLDSISFVDSAIDSMRVHSKSGPVSNFALIGYDIYFWGATELSTSSAYSRHIYSSVSDLNTFASTKTFDYSVRCVKD